MGTIYAVRDDDNRHVLIALKCDGCGAEIKPNPDIANSGWMRSGVYYAAGSDRNTEYYWCPGCWEAKNE